MSSVIIAVILACIAPLSLLGTCVYIASLEPCRTSSGGAGLLNREDSRAVTDCHQVDHSSQATSLLSCSSVTIQARYLFLQGAFLDYIRSRLSNLYCPSVSIYQMLSHGEVLLPGTLRTQQCSLYREGTQRLC
jgi:hypothetical protein